MLTHEAAASVQEWKALLQSAFPHTRQNWQINYNLISDDEMPSVNEMCDVVIRFSSKPSDPALYYRTLGTTEFVEGNPISVTVFYQNIGICREYKGNVIYQSYCYVDGTLLARSIGNTIRHELGHAFGLGHYLASDSVVSIGWSTGDQVPPSVMVIAEHNNPHKIMIKPVDLEQLRKIYGETGFAGEPQSKETSAEKIIPDWVKDNAKQWSQGVIDESEFVVALQYMIKEKIVNIPDLPIPTESQQHIPAWLKNNAKWWSEGTISEAEFVNTIKYLVQNRVIQVN